MTLVPRRSRRTFLTATGLAGASALAGGAWPRPARADGLTLAQIKAAGELRIGCEAAYVPFTYRQDGKIVGYDVELAELICASRSASSRTSSTPPGPA